MKSLNLSRCALSVCVAAIMFAGCENNGTVSQGNQQSISSHFLPSTRSHIYVRDPRTFSGETFVGKRTHAICQPVADGSIIHFKATGTAAGPFPGTFTARGHYLFSLNVLIFAERFEVTSGSQKISGVGGGPLKPMGYNCKNPSFQVEASYRLKRRSGSGRTSLTVAPHTFDQTFE